MTTTALQEVPHPSPSLTDTVQPTAVLVTTGPIYRQTSVVLQVLSPNTLVYVGIYLKNGDGSEEVILEDGFVYPYDQCTLMPISGGLQFQLQRRGGWLQPPIFRIKAIDNLGNQS